MKKHPIKVLQSSPILPYAGGSGQQTLRQERVSRRFSSRTLPLCCLAAMFTLAGVKDASSQNILSFGGASRAVLSGTGTLSDLDVGDYVLYSNLGTDPVSGISYDGLVRLNGKSNAATAVADSADIFISVGTESATRDPWIDLSIFAVESGTATAANPFGNQLQFRGVNELTAADIDSGLGSFGQKNRDFSEVFGLYNEPGAPMLGSALVNGGFERNDTNPPTTGVSYVRLAYDGFLNWGTAPNVDPTNPDNFAVWDYQSANIDEFRMVWGATNSDFVTEGIDDTTRGLNLSIEVDSIPEPSSAVLIVIGTMGVILRRRR